MYIYQSLIAKNGYMFLCKHKIQQMNIYIYIDIERINT